MTNRALIIAFTLSLLAPLSASADWLEIFHMELKDGCTAPQLQAIGDKLTKKFGADVYEVEILTNQHGENNVTSALWIGRSPNAAVWGKANDTWAAEAAANGEAAQLMAEVVACGSTLSSGSWRTVR